jgi:hypothetical protein
MLVSMSDIRRRGEEAADACSIDLQRLEKVLVTELGDEGLPTGGVVLAIEQLRHALMNIDSTVSEMSEGTEPSIRYVTKMRATLELASLDAALKYLWEDLRCELHRMVSGYDLARFFDIALSPADERRRLAGEEDLQLVDDSELLRATREMGLVSAVGYTQLSRLHRMREYVSAVNPEEAEVAWHELVARLEASIQEVVAEVDAQVISEIAPAHTRPD